MISAYKDFPRAPGCMTFVKMSLRVASAISFGLHMGSLFQVVGTAGYWYLKNVSEVRLQGMLLVTCNQHVKILKCNLLTAGKDVECLHKKEFILPQMDPKLCH